MDMELETSQQTEKAPISQEMQMAIDKAIAECEAFLEEPFNVPIEMYICARPPTVILPADNGIIAPMETIISELLLPLREGISQLLYSALGTTVLTARFGWAVICNAFIMPTIFINVPPKTVADWAELESGIRGMMGKATAKEGLAINVQFQIIYPF